MGAFTLFFFFFFFEEKGFTGQGHAFRLRFQYQSQVKAQVLHKMMCEHLRWTDSCGGIIWVHKNMTELPSMHDSGI